MAPPRRARGAGYRVAPSGWRQQQEQQELAAALLEMPAHDSLPCYIQARLDTVLSACCARGAPNSSGISCPDRDGWGIADDDRLVARLLILMRELTMDPDSRPLHKARSSANAPTPPPRESTSAAATAETRTGAIVRSVSCAPRGPVSVAAAAASVLPQAHFASSLIHAYLALSWPPLRHCLVGFGAEVDSLASASTWHISSCGYAGALEALGMEHLLLEVLSLTVQPRNIASAAAAAASAPAVAAAATVPAAAATAAAAAKEDSKSSGDKGFNGSKVLRDVPDFRQSNRQAAPHAQEPSAPQHLIVLATLLRTRPSLAVGFMAALCPSVPVARAARGDMSGTSCAAAAPAPRDSPPDRKLPAEPGHSELLLILLAALRSWCASGGAMPDPSGVAPGTAGEGGNGAGSSGLVVSVQHLRCLLSLCLVADTCLDSLGAATTGEINMSSSRGDVEAKGGNDVNAAEPVVVAGALLPSTGGPAYVRSWHAHEAVLSALGEMGAVYSTATAQTSSASETQTYQMASYPSPESSSSGGAPAPQTARCLAGSLTTDRESARREVPAACVLCAVLTCLESLLCDWQAELCASKRAADAFLSEPASVPAAAAPVAADGMLLALHVQGLLELLTTQLQLLAAAQIGPGLSSGVAQSSSMPAGASAAFFRFKCRVIMFQSALGAGVVGADAVMVGSGGAVTIDCVGGVAGASTPVRPHPLLGSIPFVCSPLLQAQSLMSWAGDSADAATCFSEESSSSTLPPAVTCTSLLDPLLDSICNNPCSGPVAGLSRQDVDAAAADDQSHARLALSAAWLPSRWHHLATVRGGCPGPASAQAARRLAAAVEAAFAATATTANVAGKRAPTAARQLPAWLLPAPGGSQGAAWAQRLAALAVATLTPGLPRPWQALTHPAVQACLGTDPYCRLSCTVAALELAHAAASCPPGLKSVDGVQLRLRRGLPHLLLHMASRAAAEVLQSRQQQALLATLSECPHLLGLVAAWSQDEPLQAGAGRLIVASSNRMITVAELERSGGVVLSAKQARDLPAAAASELLPLAVAAPLRLLRRLVADGMHHAGQLGLVLELLLCFAPIAASCVLGNLMQPGRPGATAAAAVTTSPGPDPNRHLAPDLLDLDQFGEFHPEYPGGSDPALAVALRELLVGQQGGSTIKTAVAGTITAPSCPMVAAAAAPGPSTHQVHSAGDRAALLRLCDGLAACGLLPREQQLLGVAVPVLKSRLEGGAVGRAQAHTALMLVASALELPAHAHSNHTSPPSGPCAPAVAPGDAAGSSPTGVPAAGAATAAASAPSRTAYHLGRLTSLPSAQGGSSLLLPEGVRRCVGACPLLLLLARVLHAFRLEAGQGGALDAAGLELASRLVEGVVPAVRAEALMEWPLLLHLVGQQSGDLSDEDCDTSCPASEGSATAASAAFAASVTAASDLDASQQSSPHGGRSLADETGPDQVQAAETGGQRSREQARDSLGSAPRVAAARQLLHQLVRLQHSVCQSLGRHTLMVLLPALEPVLGLPLGLGPSTVVAIMPPELWRPAGRRRAAAAPAALAGPSGGGASPSASPEQQRVEDVLFWFASADAHATIMSDLLDKADDEDEEDERDNGANLAEERVGAIPAEVELLGAARGISGTMLRNLTSAAVAPMVPAALVPALARLLPSASSAQANRMLERGLPALVAGLAGREAAEWMSLLQVGGSADGGDLAVAAGLVRSAASACLLGSMPCSGAQTPGAFDAYCVHLVFEATAQAVQATATPASACCGADSASPAAGASGAGGVQAVADSCFVHASTYVQRVLQKLQAAHENTRSFAGTEIMKVKAAEQAGGLVWSVALLALLGVVRCQAQVTATGCDCGTLQVLTMALVRTLCSPRLAWIEGGSLDQEGAAAAVVAVSRGIEAVSVTGVGARNLQYVGVLALVSEALVGLRAACPSALVQVQLVGVKVAEDHLALTLDLHDQEDVLEALFCV